MNTSPIDEWEGAAELIPWGAESFGVWLFLVIAVVAFVAMLVRAVQHENACMVHIVEDVKAAELDGRVAHPETAVAAAVAS
jgi:hypothetical protein